MLQQKDITLEEALAGTCEMDIGQQGTGTRRRFEVLHDQTMRRVYGDLYEPTPVPAPPIPVALPYYCQNGSCRAQCVACFKEVVATQERTRLLFAGK